MLHQVIQQIHGIGLDPDRASFTLPFGSKCTVDSIRDRCGHLVQVAGLNTLVDAPALHLGYQTNTSIHGDCQRLSAAHTSQPGRYR